MVRFDVETLCHRGGRGYNEDYICFDANEARCIAVVCDGLGSHGGGDVASKTTATLTLRELSALSAPHPDRFKEILQQANDVVLQQQIASKKMKSTVVFLYATKDTIYCCHIGDTRLYYFKNGTIAHQTIDHSVSQMAVARGDITPDQIRFHEDRNRLLRAIGTEDELKPTITNLPYGLEKQDGFLLCTDGFWEYITEKEMEVDFCKSTSSDEWLSYMLSRIGKKVDGTHDNLSAIAIMCQ